MAMIEKGSTALRFRFQQPGELSLLQLSSFLYDFTLLHDCIVLATLAEYKEYLFSQDFLFRGGRPLNPQHTLYLRRISYGSPLELVTAITVAAAVAGIPLLLVQAFEKIHNWKLNRVKLELEVRNQRLATEKLQTNLVRAEVDLETALRKREAMETFNRVLKRIEASDLKVIDVDFYMIDGEEAVEDSSALEDR